MWGHARVEISGLPCRGRGAGCRMQRAEEQTRKIKNDKVRKREGGWVRKRGRDSVCDSTKTALKFHHSFKRYCWISECLFTLSSHEREWWRQKDKHEEETWVQAGKNQSLLLKLSTAFTCFSFLAALLQSLLTLIPITFTVLLTVSRFKI